MKTKSTLFALIFVLGCNVLNSQAADAEKIRIVLDTDANNELDDQHAIAYMLFNGDKFDVEGITVNATPGGGEIQKHVAEAQRVVTLCNSGSKVQVIAGANGKYHEIVPHLGQKKFDGSEAVNHIIERAHADDARQLVLMPIG
jgi:purine nucleosidase